MQQPEPADTLVPTAGRPTGGRGSRLRLALLGPVEASSDTRRLDLGGPKPRLILALLAVRANRVVPTERLVVDVWSDGAPADPRAALQVNVSNLRRALATDDDDGPRIDHAAGGYVLRVEPDAIDLHRFATLVDDGTRLVPSDPHRATTVLRDALTLWRGRPFGDLADEPALTPEVRRLEELRLRAIEHRITADLELGYHDQVLTELQTLVDAHPLREPFWEQLALARYRCGQQAEALATHQRLRTLLAEELGTDPSARLRDLHARMLRQDPSLDPPSRGGRGRTEEPLRTVRGYALVEELDDDRPGTRYRALQPGTGREVVVATVPDAAIDGPADGLGLRCQRAARLDHPVVPSLVDHWRQDATTHLVSAPAVGDRLDETLERGPWRPSRAADLVRDLASGLDRSHAVGLPLPPVTTSDVVLGDDDRPVLTDLVHAAVLHGPHGPHEPHEPHDADGGDGGGEDRVADLARVAAELLTAEPCSNPTDPTHPTEPTAASPVEVVRQARPDLPRAVARVLAHALDADASDRFATAADFAAAFRGAVTGSRPDLLSTDIRNPYKGLRAFQETDRGDFFGRGRLVADLTARLDRDGLLALVGPSGSGKSSVVRAGLVPAVRRAPADGAGWVVATMTPGEWPMAELERTLEAATAEDRGDLAAELASEDGLVTAARQLLADSDQRLLLVVDQFEEAFALAREADRRAFLRQLAVAATSDGSRVDVVVTLRADFYDQLLLDPGLGPVVAERTVPVTPLTAEGVERAVTGPAEVVGLQVEPELVAAIVADVGDAPGSLPLLQYALTELCEQRDGDTLRLADYRRLGGLRGALAGRADELYDQLDSEGRAACRQVFLRLVAVTEEVVETRRRVLRPQLLDLGPDGTVEHVLETFGTHRLLTFDRDPFTRVPTVEVAHEALTRAWGRLRGWIDAARGDLVMHRRLLSASDEWRLGERDESYLLRGARLEETLAWAETSSIRLTDPERSYLDASVEARDRRRASEERRARREAELERRSVRRLRALVGVLAVAVVGALALSLVALDQRDRAREQEAAAQQQRTLAEAQQRVATARELAAAAVAELDTDPERSILLATEAVETTRRADGSVLPEAQTALHRAVRASRVETVHPAGSAVATTPDGGLVTLAMDGRLDVRGPDGDIRWQLEDRPTAPLMLEEGGNAPLVFLERTADIDVDPAGERLATTSAAFVVEVRDAATGDVLVELDRPAIRPVFAPDGGTIAAVLVDQANQVPWGAGRTFGLWDATTGELLHTFTGHQTNVDDHVFSPDGSRLVSAAPMAGTVRVWDTATGDQLQVLQRPLAKAVAYSPDGARLAIGSGDGTAAVLDATTLEQVAEVRDHEGDVFAVAFSPDGARIAVAGGGAELYDADDGREVLRLAGHTQVIADVAFTADGARLVTSAEDDTTRVWNVADPGGREVVNLPGPPPPARGQLAFSPTDGLLAAAAPDGLRLYDTATWEVVRTIPVEPVAISEVVFSADGTHLAAGLFDPSQGPPAAAVLRVWEVETGTQVMDSPAHGGMIWDLAFEPGGQRIATGTDDEGLVRVFRVGSAEPEATYQLQEGSIAAVEFTPDGLFVGGQDAGYLVDPDSGAELFALDRVDESILDDVLTDGGELVAGDIGGRVRVWDPASGELLRTLRRAPGGAVMAVDAHGGLVASAGPGGVIVSELDSGETRFELTSGHQGPESDLAVSADGRYLATAGSDGTIRLFAVPVDDLLHIARERLTRPFTELECQRFLHRDSC